MNGYIGYIETLKRLYPNHQIVRDRVEALFIEGKLTQEEYDYIKA